MVEHRFGKTCKAMCANFQGPHYLLEAQLTDLWGKIKACYNQNSFKKCNITGADLRNEAPMTFSLTVYN